MKKIFYILIITLFVAHGSSNAQSNYIDFEWNYSKLLSSDMKNFISPGTWRGFNMNYNYQFSDNFSLGILFGYQGFYEKRDRSTYEFNNGSVNAVTWRYLYCTPIIANANYTFGSGNLHPYIGGGMGGTVINQQFQYGSFAIEDKKFSFTIMAQGGLCYEFNSSWGLLFNLKYMYSFYDQSNLNTHNAGYLNLGLGFRTIF